MVSYVNTHAQIEAMRDRATAAAVVAAAVKEPFPGAPICRASFFCCCYAPCPTAGLPVDSSALPHTPPVLPDPGEPPQNRASVHLLFVTVVAGNSPSVPRTPSDDCGTGGLGKIEPCIHLECLRRPPGPLSAFRGPRRCALAPQVTGLWSVRFACDGLQRCATCSLPGTVSAAPVDAHTLSATEGLDHWFLPASLRLRLPVVTPP
jgi:hypothetical protein